MQCTVCDTPLTGRQTKYCSKRCVSTGGYRVAMADPARAARRLERNRRWAADHPEVAGRFWREHPELRRERDRRPGRKRYDKPPMTPRVKAARAKLRKAARGTTGKRWKIVVGPCRSCGDQVTLRLPAAPSQAPWCSRTCKNRGHRRAHKRRWRDRVLVPCINRHDGICWLCGGPVDVEAAVPDPLAPTIDHVVPRCHGGTDDPDNLRLAHFACNYERSDGTYAPSWMPKEARCPSTELSRRLDPSDTGTRPTSSPR